MTPLITVAAVDERLGELHTAPQSESCPLEQAAGRVLAERLVADRDLPPFDRVMMDGVAIRYRDRQPGERFTVSGEATAGAPVQALSDVPRQAISVMTGCPLPRGADTVVPLEDLCWEEDGFRLAADADVTEGQYIHRCGSDAARGRELVSAGTRLTAVEIGIAASCGYANLPVTRQPLVAVYGTGDELVTVECQPQPHQVRRSNTYAVAAALAAQQIAVHETGHFSDAIDDETRVLEALLARADVVIICGAASKGKLDWIPAALERLGRSLFHGVRQRPGKPMGVWVTDTGTTVFVLPGNPVSTLVGTHRFVLPFLLAQQGIGFTPPVMTLSEPFAFAPALTLFLPVRRSGPGTVAPCPVNNSGDFVGLARTAGFIELAADENRWTTGTPAPFYQWQ